MVSGLEIKPNVFLFTLPVLKIIVYFPGCFGTGPVPLKTKAKIFAMNTASLVTYGRIYEILLILQKDTRRAKVILELDLGAVPAPITEIRCINDELCFPRFGGVFVNPTARLALKGTCTEECVGDETYTWEIYRDTAPTTLNKVSIRLLWAGSSKSELAKK